MEDFACGVEDDEALFDEVEAFGGGGGEVFGEAEVEGDDLDVLIGFAFEGEGGVGGDAGVVVEAAGWLGVAFEGLLGVCLDDVLVIGEGLTGEGEGDAEAEGFFVPPGFGVDGGLAGRVGGRTFVRGGRGGLGGGDEGGLLGISGFAADGGLVLGGVGGKGFGLATGNEGGGGWGGPGDGEQQGGGAAWPGRSGGGE